MIPERLKLLRENKGLTKTELAKRLGMPYNTYVNYEAGTREPGSEFLIKISKFYKVSIDYIMGASDEPRNSKSLEELLMEDDNEQKIKKNFLETLLKEDDKKNYAKIAGYGGGIKTIELNEKQEQEKYYSLIKSDNEGYDRIDMTKEEFLKIKDILNIIRK